MHIPLSAYRMISPNPWKKRIWTPAQISCLAQKYFRLTWPRRYAYTFVVEHWNYKSLFWTCTHSISGTCFSRLIVGETHKILCKPPLFPGMLCAYRHQSDDIFSPTDAIGRMNAYGLVCCDGIWIAEWDRDIPILGMQSGLHTRGIKPQHSWRRTGKRCGIALLWRIHN